ncbi:dipeptidase [Pseudoteredinibacter isoporae]|uniref:dipeptidase n=1 Tax=Pseudoteredinibacter isoporae TaxID=570281 RepID=UPI00310B0F7E
MKRITITVISILLVLLLAMGLLRLLAPPMIEKDLNKVIPHEPWRISEQANALHETLLIGDWHSDSTLWDRDLNAHADRGHMDVPRLQAGNVAMQMFTSVTKSPSGQNYDRNESSAGDNITLLAVVQGWPVRTWSSLTERALYQAERLQAVVDSNPGAIQLVRNQAELQNVLQQRQQGKKTIAALLGTEGSHALDGELGNIQRLYDAGFRMMGLQHFFDNKLGGSLHGTSGAGLSDFGRKAVEQMEQLEIIVDVAHSSEAVVRDVLAIVNRPVVVSHTGFNGHCPGPRNISDELMQAIAAKGGLIAVGYWDAAVCDISPANIVKAMRFGIDLLGLEHISLGSDYDGSTEVQFDTSELAILTEEMLKAGFTETEIRAVMGENMKRFLMSHLPSK